MRGWEKKAGKGARIQPGREEVEGAGWKRLWEVLEEQDFGAVLNFDVHVVTIR